MWKVIGASVAGTSHESAGKECEDASAWLAGAELTCLAVADGAGSRRMSGRGAALAVETALLLSGTRTSGHDPGGWLRWIFASVRERISAAAAAAGQGTADYATTLAVAILTRDTIAIGQVGDTIVVAGHEGSYQTLAPAPRPEYINETTFITAHDALSGIRVTIEPAAQVDALFLSTDGLRFKILDNLAVGTPFTPFFEDVAAYTRSAGASQDAVRKFLTDLDDQSGDDKTLIAAVRI